MSNLFGQLLNKVHTAKDEAVEEMKRDLLRKHPDFPPEKVLVQDVTLPEGRFAVRVSLRDGVDDVDWQTATFTPEVAYTVVTEPTYPDHHPNHPKNKPLQGNQQEDW